VLARRRTAQVFGEQVSVGSDHTKKIIESMGDGLSVGGGARLRQVQVFRHS